MSTMSAQAGPLLDARSVTVHLRDGGRTVRAVDDVSLTVEPGECVGIVGESGSGKSMFGRALVRLLPPVELAEYSGEVVLDGTDLAALPEAELRELRRSPSISMVFQDPLRYLNPTKRVGPQVAEALPEGAEGSAEAAADELFELVGLPRAARIGRRFPHQLSGGMRQRVLLALALASRPRLLIADEPTTALDVTLQLHVLEVLKRLHREQGMSLLLITHDLALVAELCDRVAVMYAGRVVETAGVYDLFEAPRHPYTAGLLGSIPGRARDERAPERLDGSVPDLGDLPAGCRFRPRCRHAFARCDDEPPLRELGDGRTVRCWLDGADLGLAPATEGGSAA